MKDLIRSYRLAILRKHSVTDSDNESQPLVASASSSVTSFSTQQNDMRFIDSDTTDLETDSVANNKTKQSAESVCRPLVKSTPPKNYLNRNGLIFPCANNFDVPTVDVFTHTEVIYDRYEYFGKVNGGIIGDSLLGKKAYESYEEFSSSGESLESTQSSVVTVFAVWNTIMGSSLLAMAWGLEKAGFVPGIFLILAVGGICLYTSYTILKINEKHGLYRNSEVPELCRILLGRWAEIIAKIFSLIVLIGANIVYWILMSNFLYHSVHFLYSNLLAYEDTLYNNQTVVCPKHEKYNSIPGVIDNFSEGNRIFDQMWSLYSTVPIFLAVIMFPLLNFKSATFFTKFNSLGTISVAYLLIFVGIKGGTWGINIPDWHVEFHLKNTFCALSGMLSLSFFIHNIIISIMKNNRHQEHNGRDLSIAYGLVTFTYLFIGVIFYMTFPLMKNCIEDNILNNFPKSDPLTIIARVLLLFQLFTVFPLMAFMLRNDIITNLSAILKWPSLSRFSYFRVIILNGIVVTVCILFACFLPRIGTLIRYTGAFSGMVYVFTLPSLLKIASLQRDRLLTTPKLFCYVSIIILGAINLFSQFLINDS